MRAAALASLLLFGCAAREPSPFRELTGEAPGKTAAGAAAADSGRLIGVEPLSTSTIALVRSDACRRTPHPFATPIAVVEDLGIPRYPPVLSFPIAFPRSAKLESLDGFFAAAPDGRMLATQTEVLSRWGDGPVGCGAPIRWGYVHVLANVAPDRRAYLALRHDPARAESLGPAIAIDERAEEITIDTGPARFTVDRRRFVGLSRVEVKTESGVRELSRAGGAGMSIERDGAVYSSALGKTQSVELERRGPYVATIAARGTYAKGGGEKVFRYTVRLSFYAGTGAVLFDHTYYNGDTTDDTAHGGKKRVLVDRVFTRIPIAIGDGPEVVVRAADQVHRLRPSGAVSVAQDKRSPERPAAVFSVRHGETSLEVGAFADRPFIAARGDGLYAAATIGHIAVRDPQALRFDPAGPALEIDFQSEELFVGGARGIWSKAVLDFGSGDPDLVRRGDQLYAHATRPLIGAPSVAYLNTTGARGALPAGELRGEYARFDEWVDRIHEATARYLRRFRITGTQLWPDLPRRPCEPAECEALERGYFEGGDANYWDWSLVELEQFLRTADPSFVHDFALPEAITMAETISFRPDPGTRSDGSSFAGFSPCYGGGSADDGPWLEGLNHRRGVCPGDYSYNKVHYLAYVLTGDRRFTDFFTQGARTATRLYKDPRKTKPDKWLELSASRTTYQYLEPLLDAAEFSRLGGDEENRRLRDRAILYFDHMVKTTLERGHTCNLLGSGFDDPKEKGDCPSDTAWILAPWIEWVSRLARFADHAPARLWLVDFAKTSAARHTVLDGSGSPDLSQEQSSGGWKTAYHCAASKRGVRDDTCRKLGAGIENEGSFYPNGLLAYLNAFGLVLEHDAKDPAAICRWLPSAYERALLGMEERIDGLIWGKELGQAFAMTQTALGAIERCGAVGQ